MSFKKTMRGLPHERLSAKGLFHQDLSSLTPCQRECITRIKAMLDMFVCEILHTAKRKFILLEAAKHFTRPVEELDQEIRKRLNLPPEGPYTKEDRPPYQFHDFELELDLKNIIAKHYPPEAWKIVSPPIKTPDTVSSSFLSLITSNTTLPTPEPVPIPEPTLSETFLALVSTTVDKAIYAHVDDRTLSYDTAYVELTKAVEAAMEIPVIEIREEIAQLFYNAYQMFELDIMEKERMAAEIAWEKRMRKKMKRTLRRQKNFKGYETPPTPKSEISSHESYRKPPPKPCTCHPSFYFNRYPKDRFGIYMPRETGFTANNVTTTPAISMESIEDESDDVKSTKSAKSVVNKKTEDAK
ncbi:hypothetical protein K1T71_000187 [Dendrolimus kikuchii]|uniref:Uncharacterized protein n=1 Tax=Dendrolimus kikuchii TaxID=765133 RepID=A0ACC1DIG5_9NEOP|nr:hypothetical protein K1T71_000187 [Dendrolimus kikuchii]